MVPDAQLVDRVRHGDVEAFGRLAERYERSLLAIALAKLRDLHEAEDVVQETLLVAFRRLGTLREESKFGPWLMQIARSQVVEAVRARRVPASIPLNGPDHHEGDDGNTQMTIENEHLLGLVARLPQHERMLIGLRYFDGHSMAEIATISARPLGSVTKQLSRAIARLRSWYDKESLTMNQNTDLEDRLEALGAALRSRPRLTDRVMDEVRQSVTDGSIQDQSNSGRPSARAPSHVTPSPATLHRGRRHCRYDRRRFVSRARDFSYVVRKLGRRHKGDPVAKVDPWGGDVHQR